MPELFNVNAAAEPAEGVHSPGPGFGHYASYHALWHLQKIGLVPDLVSFDCEAWKTAGEIAAEDKPPTRVALIDVSVAYTHPNLEGAVLTDLMIDFFSQRLGTFPRPGADDQLIQGALSAAESKAAELPDGPVRALFVKLYEHIATEYAQARDLDWRTPFRVAPATSPEFSAHATAMAGLIGARPRGPKEVRIVQTGYIAGDGSPSPDAPAAVGFPYAGVDPFCHIIPISTSFDPDPEQLILAMLYAWLIDADVIVLARDFADPVRATIGRPGDDPELRLKFFPVAISPAELELWDGLAWLTLELSKQILIVCAAGNGGGEPVMYPASLARDDNGIVSVGARAATGQVAGYSSTGAAAGGVTVYAPSGDGERLDRDMQRLDTADAGFVPADHSSRYLGKLGVQHPAAGEITGGDDNESIFATQEIISTDVPGAAGYNNSAFGRAVTGSGSIFDYRSYYCHFSGTSAAAAIVAGALSLAMSAGLIDRGKPLEAKRRLRGEPAEEPGSEADIPDLSWARFGKFDPGDQPESPSSPAKPPPQA